MDDAASSSAVQAAGLNPAGMVEKVARAIYEAQGAFVSWKDQRPIVTNRYRKTARAAIRAMHDPSGEMLAVGVTALRVFQPQFVADTWSAMIDEALK